jgi:hypothetical protein
LEESSIDFPEKDQVVFGKRREFGHGTGEKKKDGLMDVTV